MRSKVSERAPAVSRAKVETEPKRSTSSEPPPSQPAAWTAPPDKARDAWNVGTSPRPSIAPPPPSLVSEAPIVSARSLAAVQSPSASPQMTRVLKTGVSGDDVRQLQARLGELGFNVSRSGRYDASTERAVRTFQRSRELTVDGDAGRNTLRALGFTFGTPSSGGTQGRVLKRGMQGEDVRALQRQLKDHGQHLRVTGSFDAATERAVENFQRARGLQVDGDAGPETLTALGSAHVTPRANVTPRTDVAPHVHHDGEPHVHHTPGVAPSRPAAISENAAFGDVRERAAIASRITVGRGSETDVADVAAVRAEVAKLPLDMLRELDRAGVRVVACRGSVVDAVPGLRTERPRGWPPGRGWDHVAGAYMPGAKEVIIATRAAPGGGREVSPHGTRHGSVSLVAHEAGHALDAVRRSQSREDADFQRAYQQDLRAGQLLPYYTQPGDAGPSEAYAESLALYLSGDPRGEGARRFPNQMRYWADQYRPEPA